MSDGHDTTHTRRLEEHLRQVQKTEALGQLAGGVAYDFNNRLALITTYATLLLEKCDDEPSRSALEEILDAANEASAMMRQFLAFSREPASRPATLDLNNVVREFGKMLHRVIGAHIHFVTVLDVDLGQVKAMPGQIHQILMNLAFNARDAMPHGGKLTIETANVTLDETFAPTDERFVPGNYVVLTVIDTGAGMEPILPATHVCLEVPGGRSVQRS